MRINNDIRNYITKTIQDKAIDKLHKIDSRIAELEKKEKVVKEKTEEFVLKYMNQLANESDKAFKRFMTEKGYKFSDNMKFIEANEHLVRHYCEFIKSEELEALLEKRSQFEKEINKTVETILFKLSLGCDYETAIKELDSIKF